MKKRVNLSNILVFFPGSIDMECKKIKATNILASKLCRCIKKVDKTNEGKSIGICSKTIINNKGYKRGNFTCKKKETIILSKKIKKNKTKKIIKKK
jgi:hypothetical protein